MTDPTTPPSGTVAGDEQDMTVMLPSGLPLPAVMAAPPQPGELPDDDLGNALPIGTRMGEFELLSMIGEGGFGIVYLAQDHSLGRRVAIKEYMPSSLAARTQAMTVSVRSRRHQETFEAGLRSFMEEARLLARFDHPSLIKVYRFWRANGTAYMVMPYYVGRTLSAALKAGDAPPDEAWLRALLAPVLDALEVMHRDSTYHRDIAPDNIMLLEDGRPVVLDLGAARKVISDMTQALTVILKTGYAPIEQYGEMPGVKQGPWTDLYALASVVYFAIRRQTPPQSVTRVVVDKFEPLSTVAAGRYSAGFLAAIDECLAVMPQHRPQSIAQFREMLAATATEAPAPVPVRPAPVVKAVVDDEATVMRPAVALPSQPVAPVPAPPVTRPSPPLPQPSASAPPASAPVGKPAVAVLPVASTPYSSGLNVKWIAAGAALAVGLGGLAYTLTRSPTPAPAPVAPVSVNQAAPVAAPPPAVVAAPAPAPVPSAVVSADPPVPKPAPEPASKVAKVEPKPAVKVPPAPRPAPVTAPPAEPRPVAQHQTPPAKPRPPAPAKSEDTDSADARPPLSPQGQSENPVWSPGGRQPKVTRVAPPEQDYVTQVKCNDLLQKVALGDPVSAADRAFVKRECH